jgi:hypothetical protein
MGTVASAREFLAAGCAMAVVLLTAGGGGARMLPAKACPLDTTKVETAMETAVELAALDRRVDDAFRQLQRLPQGPDRRFMRNRLRADWLCAVARQCGEYAAGDDRLGRCLQDALRLRAIDLEGQLEAALKNH